MPLLGLALPFTQAQKLYAVVGAGFLPLLAAALLVLNGNRRHMGEFANRPTTSVALVVALAFFVYVAIWPA